MSQPIKRRKRRDVAIVDAEELTNDMLLSITNSTLAEYLTLTPNDATQSEDVLHIPTYASVQRISLEEACHQLEDVPCPNTVRSQLNETVLKEIETVEDNVNAAIAFQWPRRMTKKAQKVAMDLVLIPYHGLPDEEDDEIRRGKAKSGTTHFHCYGTAYVIKRNKRITLAITYVRGNDTLVEILGRLLSRLGKVKIRLRSLLLDKEFYTVAVIRYLKKKVSSFQRLLNLSMVSLDPFLSRHNQIQCVLTQMTD